MTTYELEEVYDSDSMIVDLQFTFINKFETSYIQIDYMQTSSNFITIICDVCEQQKGIMDIYESEGFTSIGTIMGRALEGSQSLVHNIKIDTF